MDVLETVWGFLLRSANTLVDLWPVKVLISMVLAVGVSSYGPAVGAFVVLIFIDLMTRWVAISYQCLTDEGKEDRCLWTCVLEVPGARAKGYIKSEAMKHRFGGKIILYFIIIIMAGSADKMIAPGSVMLLNVAMFYLAATEMISILENLQAAGVENVDPLLTFIRGKMASILGTKDRGAG